MRLLEVVEAQGKTKVAWVRTFLCSRGREGSQAIEVWTVTGEQDEGSVGGEDREGDAVSKWLFSRKMQFIRTHDPSLEEFKTKTEL